MNRVKGYRIMLGMTQKEMADVIGVSINTYRDMEDNPDKFRVDQANKFLEAVNKVDGTITLNDIFLN